MEDCSPEETRQVVESSPAPESATLEKTKKRKPECDPDLEKECPQCDLVTDSELCICKIEKISKNITAQLKAKKTITENDVLNFMWDLSFNEYLRLQKSISSMENPKREKTLKALENKNLELVTAIETNNEKIKALQTSN